MYKLFYNLRLRIYDSELISESIIRLRFDSRFNGACLRCFKYISNILWYK